MEPQKITPLKVGLVTVALSYFLFTFHDLFNLQWVGEWNRPHTFLFNIFIEDINAEAGLVSRFIASMIALVAVIYYLRKTALTAKAYKILRWIAVFEAIYWFGLLATTEVDARSFLRFAQRGALKPTLLGLNLTVNLVADVAESIFLPIVLLILAYLLNPGKKSRKITLWAQIAGTAYIFVFWLTNTNQWLSTILVKGTTYLTKYPQNMTSFIITTFGLLALGILSIGFIAKSRKAPSLEKLNLKVAGSLVTLLGLYFLWNYVGWILFGTPYSSWVAWFLGHNLDLWMLSLPLIGIPMLFYSQDSDVNTAKK